MRLPETTWAVAVILGGSGCAQLLSLEDRTIPDAGESSSSSSGASNSSASSGSSQGSGSTGSQGGGSTSGGTGSNTGSSTGSASGTSTSGSSSTGTIPDGGPPGDSGPPPGDGGCVPTAPCQLASQLDWPSWVAADGNNVYWSEAPVLGTGAIKACAITGCAKPLVYVSGLSDEPGQVAIDATTIYWATYSSTTNTVRGGIWSCPLTGCNLGPHPIFSGDGIQHVAVDGTNVYWVNAIDESVHKIPKGATNGAGASVLYAGTTDSNDPYYYVSPGQVALDASNLYFTDTFGGAWRAPLAGGHPVAIISGSASGDPPIAIDTTSVYYGDNGVGAIVRVAKTATTASPGTAVASVGWPYGIAIDSPTSTAYWADINTNPGSIGKGPLSGGAKQLIDRTVSAPRGVALASTYVFYANQGAVNSNDEIQSLTGSIWRAPK